MSVKTSKSIELNLRSRALGICINGPHLEVVGLRNQINQLHFKGWDRLADFEQRTDEDVQDFLEEVQSRFGVKRADMFMVLPRSEFVIQVAEFPPEAANNLEEATEYQLANYFAVDLDEYNFFSQIIHKSDQLKVMIAGVKKAYLGHAFGFIRRWGLGLAGMTLDSFALYNGLSKLHPKRVGDERTVVFRGMPDGLEMLAIREGKLVLSHFIPITLEENLDGEAVLPQQDLILGIEQGFSMARLDPQDVEHYLWAGADLEEVRHFLAEEAFIPFSSPWVDGQGDPIPAEALVGVGAAISSVHDNLPLALNTMPEKLRKHRKRLPIIVATVLISLVFLFVVVSEAKEFVALANRYEKLDTRYQDLEQRMLEVSSVRAEFQARQAELTLYKKFQTNRMLTRMISSMATDLPLDAYLTALVIKQGGDQVSIQGEASDPFEVQRILTNMPFLVDVKPSNAITSGRNKDGKRRFIYKARINLEALQ